MIIISWYHEMSDISTIWYKAISNHLFYSDILVETTFFHYTFFNKLKFQSFEFIAFSYEGNPQFRSVI